ncbi:arsinothricin resistance N-acetyltransferase ArsN1 family A [Tahibacter sp.]|uniref:arsinothricin resistance N-acetyltransferase ArsN1 family A n=1 Tax=Tahibacter sp. TaxID=2056211 RepID=UPI0028C40042|nr:arsinothricin resistance N-acetyltransferase ArsN1 family A [Tahibacter sp.]
MTIPVSTLHISTRSAFATDAPAITAIYNEGIAARSATFETQPRSVDDLLPRIADSRYPLRVATDPPDRVVGWAGLSSYRARDCYAGIAEFSIYVDAAVRGQGVGRVLLGDLIDAARAAGFWKVLSRVFPFNTASLALCRACGFREVGRYEKHGRLDGQWLDVVIVERLIPENLAGAAGSLPTEPEVRHV